MTINADSSLLTTGLVVGLAAGQLGRWHRVLARHPQSKAPISRHELPGCMLYMAGALALAGMMAL